MACELWPDARTVCKRPVAGGHEWDGVVIGRRCNRTLCGSTS